MPEKKLVVERQAIDSIETNKWIWRIEDEEGKVYQHGLKDSFNEALKVARENLGKKFYKKQKPLE